jgi:hypothetical protein
MNKKVNLTSVAVTILVYLFLSAIISSCIPDTKYSVGYTDEKFASIKIGMTEKQVLDILGEPLTRWRPYQHTNFKDKRHFVGLQYSESPSGTHYQLRQVYLDSGIVAEKIQYFYID